MPYSSVRSDIANRFIEVNHLLNNIKSLEDAIVPPTLPSVEFRIIKGLFYVHLYACIEYSVNKIITHTLTIIKSKNIVYKDFENKFYTIALASNVQSVKDCSPKTFLDKTADLFIKLDSGDISSINETFMDQYLQNVWGKTFNQLTKTLGTNTFLINARESAIFDEVVDNRNKVAHGRDTAENVGAAPTYLDLKKKFDTANDTINRFIDHLQIYYNNKEFIKVTRRTNY